MILTFIFLIPIYILILWAIILRISEVFYFKLLVKYRLFALVVEIIITCILPIIGFVMIFDMDKLDEVNRGSLLRIDRAVLPIYISVCIAGSLFYGFLRIKFYQNPKRKSKIYYFVIIPALLSFSACLWLGESLLYGLIPIFITLPVLSPLLSFMYSVLLLVQVNTNISSGMGDETLIDDFLTQNI